MVTLLTLLGFLFAADSVASVYAQFGSRHKSEAEVARMTPEQRVNEYCTEIARHSFWHDQYVDLLETYVHRDGLRAVTGAVKIVDDYDPMRGVGKVNDCLDTAQALLDRIDSNIVRLESNYVERGQAVRLTC